MLTSFRKFKNILVIEGVGLLRFIYLTLFKKSKIARIPKPNLFIIGLPKCGTTSLHIYLSQHSKIISSNKELAHFSYHNTKWYNKKLGLRYQLNYQYEFKNYSNETYLLDSTPNYIHYRQSLEAIFQFNSNAKIIILFRDPLERIISSYYQRLNNPYKKQMVKHISLEQYVENIIDNANFPNNDNAFGYALYVSQYIKNAYDIFGKERIYFMRLESFVTAPKVVFDKLLRFLNLEAQNIDLTTIHNQGNSNHQSLSQTTKNKLFVAVKPDLAIIEKLTDKNLYAKTV